MSKVTQEQRLLRHFADGMSITQSEAMAEYGIMRLASRISDLRRAGVPIEKDTVEAKNRYGETVRFARYRYVGERSVPFLPQYVGTDIQLEQRTGR